MTHDEMIAVIYAHKEGRRIEYATKGGSNWSASIVPAWDFNCLNYRIAREPRKAWIKWAKDPSSMITAYRLAEPKEPGWQEVTEQL